jgi:hypothetical protein
MRLTKRATELRQPSRLCPPGGAFRAPPEVPIHLKAELTYSSARTEVRRAPGPPCVVVSFVWSTSRKAPGSLMEIGCIIEQQHVISAIRDLVPRMCGRQYV